MGEQGDANTMRGGVRGRSWPRAVAEAVCHLTNLERLLGTSMYYGSTCIRPCKENTNERPKAPPRDEPHITPSPMRLCAMRLCRVLRGRGATRRGSALRYPDTVDSERRSGSVGKPTSRRSVSSPNGPTDQRSVRWYTNVTSPRSPLISRVILVVLVSTDAPVAKAQVIRVLSASLRSGDAPPVPKD